MYVCMCVCVCVCLCVLFNRMVFSWFCWCQRTGIDVSEGAAPAVVKNVVERGNGSGIHIHDQGRGSYS